MSVKEEEKLRTFANRSIPPSGKKVEMSFALLPFAKKNYVRTCTYIFRKLKSHLFYLPSTIGVAQTHTAEANAIKAINLIVEAMLLRMIKTRTTNYETGFYVTEVRQLSC